MANAARRQSPAAAIPVRRDPLSETSTARTSAKSTSGPSAARTGCAAASATANAREIRLIDPFMGHHHTFRLSIGWKGHRGKAAGFHVFEKKSPINALTSHTSRLAYQPRTLQHAINRNKISMEERMTIKMTRRGLLERPLAPWPLHHRCTWPGCQTSGKSRCVEYHRRCGNLQLTQVSIERFARENPKIVSRVTFSRAPSPELPSKLKAQQQADKVDIDLVLTGPGALSDGIQQGLWVESSRPMRRAFRSSTRFIMSRRS